MIHSFLARSAPSSSPHDATPLSFHARPARKRDRAGREEAREEGPGRAIVSGCRLSPSFRSEITLRDSSRRIKLTHDVVDLAPPDNGNRSSRRTVSSLNRSCKPKSRGFTNPSESTMATSRSRALKKSQTMSRYVAGSNRSGSAADRADDVDSPTFLSKNFTTGRTVSLWSQGASSRRPPRLPRDQAREGIRGELARMSRSGEGPALTRCPSHRTRPSTSSLPLPESRSRTDPSTSNASTKSTLTSRSRQRPLGVSNRTVPHPSSPQGSSKALSRNN